jgi:hypothetical protein
VTFNYKRGKDVQCIALEQMHALSPSRLPVAAYFVLSLQN